MEVRHISERGHYLIYCAALSVTDRKWMTGYGIMDMYVLAVVSSNMFFVNLFSFFLILNNAFIQL